MTTTGHFIAIIPVLIMYHVIAATGQVIFEDRFSDNQNKWRELRNKEMTVMIQDGKFLVERKTTPYASEVWRFLDIDQDENFSIETVTEWLGGVDTTAYGLLWGKNQNNSTYKFLITASGRFIIANIHQGDIVELYWQESEVINKRSVNHLKINRVGDRVEFYINDNPVEQLLFSGLYGTLFGFSVENKQKIAFDDFIIRKLSTPDVDSLSLSDSGHAGEEKAANKEKSYDRDTALNLSQKSGLKQTAGYKLPPIEWNDISDPYKWLITMHEDCKRNVPGACDSFKVHYRKHKQKIQRQIEKYEKLEKAHQRLLDHMVKYLAVSDPFAEERLEKVRRWIDYYKKLASYGE